MKKGSEQINIIATDNETSALQVLMRDISEALPNMTPIRFLKAKTGNESEDRTLHYRVKKGTL